MMLAGLPMLLLWQSITCAQALAPTQTTADPAVVLSRQVWALQTIHDLDLDASQLEQLKAIVPNVEEEATPRIRSKAPAKYIAALEALRDALLKDKDSGETKEQIDELRDDLESMREDQQIEVDDRVKIADPARAKTPEAMKLLRPSQTAGYIAAYQDEVPDPVQVLQQAAEDARGADDGKFNELASKTSRDLSILIAGLDEQKQKPLAERINHWLEQARTPAPADAKTAKAEQEQSARAVLGDFDSFDVLRHWLERDVAEMLSNPQTRQMIDERLKVLKKPE